MVGLVIMGTLRSNDAEDNENVQKTIGFISKTTTSHVHHTFLYISFPFMHGYDAKMLDLVFYGERRQATTKLYLVLFLFLSLDNGHLKFSFRRVRLHLRK